MGETMTRGRPTKLTKGLVEKIVEALRRGTSIEAVSALVGISRQSFYNWLKRGVRAREQAEATGAPIPGGERLYVALAAGVEQAIAEWEERQLIGIEDAGKAGPQYWTARAWLLERRHPSRYGRRDRVDHRHQVSLEVADVSDVVPEVLDWTEESEDPDPSLPPPRDNGNTKGAPPG